MFMLNSVSDANEIKKGIENYEEAISWVTSYCFAITQTESFVLEKEEDWYEQFQKDMMDAKTHGLTWIDSITIRLTTIPNTIVSYDLTYQSCSDTIKSCLNMLIADPANKQARKTLVYQMVNLLDDIKRYQKNITQLFNDLQLFKCNLDADAASFKKNYDNALNTKAVDQEQIEYLTELVAELTAEVNKLMDDQIVYTITGSILFSVGVIFLRCFKKRGIIAAALGLLSIGTTAGIIAAEIQTDHEIAQKNIEIDKAITDMSIYDADIATLGIISSSLEQLTEIIGKAMQGLEIINKAWSLLANQIEHLYYRLEDARGEVASSDYQEAMDDIIASEKQWNDLVKYASQFVDVKYLYDETHYELLTA